MDWQPSMDWQTAKQRAEILKSIRDFFALRNVIEVETPALSQGTITDVHLEAISASYAFNETGISNLYLQTSPEYAMKRLLAAGYQSIFQLSKAFRNEEYGRVHNPEFTMLEWYRLDFTMEQLIKEVSDLLCEILNVDGSEIVSYQHAFLKHTKVDPLSTNIEECITFLKQKGKLENWLIEANCLDTLLQFIFCEFIEPNIGTSKPCFVHSYPASQAALAKLNMSDNRIANRFECYFKGIELVNGFDELTDSATQLQRFKDDNSKRLEKGLPVREIDIRFVNALKSGLPRCAGVALGVDRLVMLALNKRSIEQVLTFPINKA